MVFVLFQCVRFTTGYIYNLKGLRAVKVKVKFTLEQATKAQRGSRVIALLFL